MEKRMYVNSYLKRADKAPSYDDPDLTEAEKVPGCLRTIATLLVEDFFFAVHRMKCWLVDKISIQRVVDTFRRKPGVSHLQLAWRPSRQEVTWVYKKQFAKVKRLACCGY